MLNTDVYDRLMEEMRGVNPDSEYVRLSFDLFSEIVSLPRQIMAGRVIYYGEDGNWRHYDTGGVAPIPRKDELIDRPCPACGLDFEVCTEPEYSEVPEQHDPCLGHMEGVSYACCGHGGRAVLYIMTKEGDIFYGKQPWDGIETTKRIATRRAESEDILLDS